MSEPTLADDEAALADFGRGLASAIREALPVWVERCVTDRAPTLAAEAQAAGRRAASEVGDAIAELLARDIADQTTNPLSILRGAVRYPAQVLAAAGVPRPERERFSAESFPDDHYDLTPASFADIDPSVHEPGLMWGAAKAHVHLRRRREAAPIAPRRVVALVVDLMDRSKFSAVEGVELVRSTASLVESAPGADLVIIDLSRPGAVDAVGRIDGPVIGFGSHVDDELLAEAAAAGCDEVLPRSVFFRRLAAGEI